MADRELRLLPGDQVVVVAPSGQTLSGNYNTGKTRLRVIAAGTPEPPPVDPPIVTPPPDPPPVPPTTTDPTPPAGFTTIQAAIDAAPAGAVIGIPAKTYSETFTPKQGQRLVPVGGTVIIDGGNSRQSGINISASDVTLDKGSAASAWFEVRNHRPPYQHGAIQHNSGDRLTLIEVRSHDNPGAGKGQDQGNQNTIGGGLALNGGTGHKVIGGDYYANETMGIHANGGNTGKDWSFQKVSMRGNNPGGYNLRWHSAGLKATQLDGLLIEDCIVSGNNADGIWGDINTRNAVIRRNRIDHNTQSGVHSEIEELWTIEDNVIWECGWGRTDGGGWGAGLQIVENRLDSLNRNTVAWCNRGITFFGNVDPNRKGSFPVSKPGSYDGLTMSGNVVITSDGYLIWTAGDVAPDPVDATGRYWSAVGPVQSAGPSGTTNLTVAQRDAILTAAGIPLVRS